jgi:hypothetical protein
MKRPEEPETAEMPGAVGGLYVQDVLDEIEAELTASPAVPVAGQVALNPERMAALTARLRTAVAEARERASEPAAVQAELRQAEAQAALILEDARRKAEMLLDGQRVQKLREERVQEIISESRQRGQVLVAQAYEVGRQRMEVVAQRAEEARRLVAQAGDVVRPQGPGAAARAAEAARNIVMGRGGLLSRFFRS